MASCSYCGGAGGRYEGYMACGRCGGSGRGSHTNVACIECGGSGQSSSQRWVPCTACHGSGSSSSGAATTRGTRQPTAPTGPTTQAPAKSKSKKTAPPAGKATWTGWNSLFAVLGYFISLSWLRDQGGLDGGVMFGLAIFPALLIGRYWKVLLGIALFAFFLSANKG